jgi:type VI secretion system protein ImpL
VFGSLLAGQPDPIPTLDIVPAFRVNQSREINGNQIIDWTLQVGDETFRYHDPERAGRWNFGDPVKLTLRWAKDSPQQPVTARQAVDGKLNNRTVTFEYHDSWSLFTLLALHRPAASDFSRMVDPDPQTLVFAINASKSSDPASTSNQPTPEAKVFVRIRLRAPGKPDNLRLQPFPIAAPDLEQTQIQAGAGGNNP